MEGISQGRHGKTEALINAYSIFDDHFLLRFQLSGKVLNGLISLQSGRYTVYALGSTVVLRDTKKNVQTFLKGHTDEITCLTLSRDGKRLASGQQGIPGQKAAAIIWV